VSSRDHLRQLVDRLPESELSAAERFLSFLCADPVLLALANAPEDDEPETEEERLAVEEARESLRRGAGISHEELRRELGL